LDLAGKVANLLLLATATAASPSGNDNGRFQKLETD
jgi:hypothetical protein